MKRLLLFLCCISLSWLARGQAAYEWRYWFDMGLPTGNTGRVFGERFTIETDSYGLSEGIHTINMQVTDTAGRFSPPFAQLFYHVTDNTVKKLHYWFDNEEALTHSIPMTQGNFSIDVSGLDPGLHFIYCIAEDAAGNRSDALCRAFYRQPKQSALRWSYWFDEDENARATIPLPNGVVMIDISELQEGFHVFHSQVLENASSDITTTMFIKVPQTEGTDYMTCISTVDGNLVAEEKLSAAGGILKWDMDVSKMDVGLHKAMFQVITPSGAASTIAERYFIREITSKELGNMKCVYAIDNLETYSQAGTHSNGVFHFDLDVASIENGLHRIAYMLVSEEGVTTPQKTAFFWKTPLGGDGIVKYDYWLNENDDQKHSVRLTERTNPFNLISLLPVEVQPIRTSNFKFAIKDGEPQIYARNEFHIQFFDTNGRVVEETKEYVDEQVSMPVKPVGELQATQTFPKIAENDIRWYTMQAAPGDTVAFKLSQPATMQLFAPSGEEVFRTSESASVNWNGIHTWEKGTYYLAVHDVTGSQSTMKLEYMHMDKYDVVDWDVRKVGNGGCSTITFKGNGFRDLYAVDLYNAQGDTIRSVDVGHESDAETAVTFDFTGTMLGDYNAVFHFTEEDKPFANVVTVEEAVEIELATDVTFPSSFLRGTSTTYTVKITNKGNMTAYSVPIYIYCETPTITGISHLELSGLQLSSILEGINIEKLNIKEKEELETWANQIGHDHYFLRIKKALNAKDSVIVRSNYFVITIPPNETKVVKLTLKSDQKTNVWFTSLKSLPPFSFMTCLNPHIPVSAHKISTSKMYSKEIRDWYCCIRDRSECMLDRVSYSLDRVALLGTDAAIALAAAGLVVGPEVLPVSAAVLLAAQGVGGAGLLTNTISTTSKVYGNAICGDSNTDILDALRNSVYGENRNSVTNTLLNLILDYFEKHTGNPVGTSYSEAKHIQETFAAAQYGITYGMNTYLFGEGNQPLGLAQCMAFKELNPDCIPENPSGGSSTPYTPVDPNDIYGYLSPAGSKFITDSVAKVNYTIEFENDTAFATAAAHSIVIKDTLDKKYFVLEEFMPTGVRIGDREVFLKETEVKTQNDVTSFVKTIDMRPEINAIAQVDGTFNSQTGIAQWTFQSLDPMTMEPTNDLMQGILPVNHDGKSGIGEVMYEIGVKSGKADGTEIKNRASIVFDYEDAILTPTWTNIVDAVAPTSKISDLSLVNDTTLRITADGFDARSGVWKYEWYVQAGENAPWWKEGETDSLCFDYRVYADIDYGFCVVATDSAGNVEKKVIQRERGFRMDDQGNVDAIIDVPVDAGNDNPEAVYDLSGRKQLKPQENRINIVGKKKILYRREGQ